MYVMSLTWSVIHLCMHLTLTGGSGNTSDETFSQGY